MQNQQGFVGAGVLIAILIALAVLGGGTYYVAHRQSVPQTTSDNSEKTQTLPTNNQQTQTTIKNVPKDQNATLQKSEIANWKTYTNAQYGFSFKYPPNWFIHEPTGEAIYFSKSATTPPAQEFASIYASNLNYGKEGSAPVYATPQEYFDYYYRNDTQSTLGSQPRLQSLQLGQVPAIHHLVVGDNRYVVYTNDREIGFVLYPGNNQNPTEFSASDNALMEEIIRTLSLTNSSKSFVKIDLSSAGI